MSDPGDPQDGREELFYSDSDALAQRAEGVLAAHERDLAELLAEHREMLGRVRAAVRDAEQRVLRIERALTAIRVARGEIVEPVRGKHLGDLAVRVLRESRAEQPIHYADWFRLIEDAGYVIGGNDAGATFLTAVSRDERVEKVAPNRSGLYRLRGES